MNDILVKYIRKNMLRTMNVVNVQYYAAPCGEMILGSYAGQLCLCDWLENRRRAQIDARLQRMLAARYEVCSSEVVSRAASELEEYFNGVRTAFDIPLLMLGTEFQKQVWHALCAIPYGSIISYGEEARLLGKANAVRAVANANGANALSVLVPCHRVVGSDGALGGYGGGLDVKRYLLGIEGADATLR